MSVHPVPHHFTADEYHGIGDAGLFPPDHRLELLEGEVFEMAPIGSRHAAIVKQLNDLFVPALHGRAIIGVQDPVRLSDLSEPQPDLTLLRWRPDFYRSDHPTPEDVLLLIEVSDTTASWDRNVKRRLYSAAAINEVWIVDLESGVIEVATDPTADGYHQVRQVGPGGSVTPQAFRDMAISVADLLA